jgi:phosphoglycerate dehydrogenase-like enzyme
MKNSQPEARMNIQNLLVAGNYQQEFEKYYPNVKQKSFRFIPMEEITKEDLAWADAYVGFKPCPSFQLSNLKWVHTFNAGVNNFLEMEGWKEYEVVLTRTVCSFGERVSEYCLSYILRDLQYHTEFQQKQYEKKWIQKTPKRLRDQTIVIFGTGAIGQEVAKTFHSLGATVLGVSGSGEQKKYFNKIVPITISSTVVCEADWIISTLPLTKQTYRVFNQELFQQMNSSGFINVGRGATVDEQALLTALDSGNIRSAILDVVDNEPLLETSPLWTTPNVTITPHISAVTELNEAIECFAQTLHALEKEQMLPNQVDFSKGY